MLDWCADVQNFPKFQGFAAQIIDSLSNCLPLAKSMKKIHRERMWGNFHQLRTSSTFCELWQEFTSEATGRRGSPLFYQRLTDVLFKNILEYIYNVSTESVAERTDELTYEETNGLRYAAGYIPRALCKRIERSSHQLKDSLILCLQDLVEDDGTADDDSDDWVTLVDRGGLKYVTDDMFHLVKEMEYELRFQLKSKVKGNFKEATMRAIMQNDDVLYYWSLISSEWEEERELLLPMIIDLWITMRGFSFASAWIENYKIANKKTIQKMAGKRKQLQGTMATTENKD